MRMNYTATKSIHNDKITQVCVKYTKGMVIMYGQTTGKALVRHYEI